MRLFAIFPLLCALAALTLSLLCLFAGSNRSFLSDVDIATVNVSRLGHTPLFNTSDGDGGLLSDLGNAVESGINDLAGNLAEDIADAIGIHDFYKVHVMNYCEGFYKPNATADNAKQNITFCSKRNAMFHFNLSSIVGNELISGTSLDDLHWPDEIQEKLAMLKTATRAMFVFFCIGIAFAGIGVLTSAIGVLGGGRISALGNFGIFILGFLSLGIASILATVISVKLVSTLNKYGRSIGLAAYRGDMFLGMTWASVIIMLLGSFAWIFECIIGRRRSKTYSEKP